MTLKFSPKVHRYWLDGKTVPGVTTIIGKGLPKPALPYWAARTVAEYVADDPARIARLLADNDKASAVAALKQVPWTARDVAAVRGTEVHALAEQVVKGETVEVPVHLARHVKGYVQLIDELDLEPVAVESPVASRTHRYAGTADLFATVHGEPWLLDLKTSSGVYGDYALQLAAYAHADFMGDLENPEYETAVPEAHRYGVIHVTEDGATLHEYTDTEGAWDAFLKVKAVADITKTIEEWGASR